VRQEARGKADARSRASAAEVVVEGAPPSDREIERTLRWLPDLVKRNLPCPDRLWVADITYVPGGLVSPRSSSTPSPEAIAGWSMANNLKRPGWFWTP